MLRAADLTRVTWCCLHYAAAAEITAQLRVALQNAGIASFDLDGDRVRTRDDLLRGIADAMQFPDYFGMNWDAVIDCLRDLADRQPAEGYVLFVHAAERLWRQGLSWMGELVEVWLTAAEESAHEGVPLHLVFVSPSSPA
ncbi:MAG TPA: barstar family protein [Candidatus Acidoferrum sp.]|nr:barstar family protein [Candidatus Acidoferrum sp.]